ncbi:MAG: PIN domain-containing protein [Betaproteobacteria bacterium]|nr:PIN domain-containing protein [Betaproteobacteria bacterium]
MRIFLDANVLFSAPKSAGAIHQLLTLAMKQKHALCADEYVAAEARRNLQAKAAPDAIERLDTLLMKIEVSPARMDATEAESIAWLLEKDRPVLAAAIRLKCDALVTGDVAHFGAGFGKRFGGVTLYSPRMLYDAISKST